MITPQFQCVMDEDSQSYSPLDRGHRKPRRDRIHGKLSIVLMVSGALVSFILVFMIFVIFNHQERKFAELERSLMNYNCSPNSELRDRLEETGTEVGKMFSDLKNSVLSLNSTLNTHYDGVSSQLSCGPQMKMSSDVQTLMNNLSSISSKLETKLQDAAGQHDGQFMDVKRFLEHLNSSVSELKAKLQDTVVQQDGKLGEIRDSLTNVDSSLASYESKQQKQTQDSDQRVMVVLSEIKTKLESSSKAAESQDRMLTEVQNLSSSVASLSSQIDRTDQRVMAALSVMKAKLEINSKAAESQNRTLAEVEKLASSVESLSSKLQNTDQRLMAALNELKAKLKSSSEPAVLSCKTGWILNGSHCYFFSNDKLNWHQARDYCRSQNALLLKLETKDEWEFVTARTTLNHYWVGLTDETTGQWRWDDGTPYVMDTDEWEPGQPDDWKNHGLGEEGEDCGHLKRDGKLNDAHCSLKNHYICKV